MHILTPWGLAVWKLQLRYSVVNIAILKQLQNYNTYSHEMRSCMYILVRFPCVSSVLLYCIVFFFFFWWEDVSVRNIIILS